MGNELIERLRGEMIDAIERALSLRPSPARTQYRRAASEYAAVITALARPQSPTSKGKGIIYLTPETHSGR